MKFPASENVRISVPAAALAAVFHECDRYDHDETGGRVLGTYQLDDDYLRIQVTGILEPGPGSRRSAVSFFQDGAYQEQVFRRLERDHAQIEHLGNWHTHHVNGLSHLSGGDIQTYQRTVNHGLHNTPFFYALLVVSRSRSKNPLRRYHVKHYLVRRGDERVFEVPQQHVEIVDTPLIWPIDAAGAPGPHTAAPAPAARPDRVYDRDILQEFFAGLRTYSSPKLGLYWRGALPLVDGSQVEVVLVEDASAACPAYSVALRNAPAALEEVAGRLHQHEFTSARAALVETERRCNRELFLHLEGSRRGR